MNMYATISSERATKGQGGNKHLEININVGTKEPQYRVRVINDELLGIYYISFEAKIFGTWTTVYRTEQYYNVPETCAVGYCAKHKTRHVPTTKGEKQKGETLTDHEKNCKTRKEYGNCPPWPHG